MSATIHLIKICVGAAGVEDLATWQALARSRGADGNPRHVTRMWPKRSDELYNGGSLYWVFKGSVLARQKILRLDEAIGSDGIRRCAIILDPTIIRTHSATRRPFQGWRYLAAADAPPDLPKAREGDDTLPPDLDAALAELGLQ